MIKIPKVPCRDMLGDLVAGQLNGAKIRLFSNTASLGTDPVIGDLTTAVFSGYADSAAITWGSVFTNVDGKAQVTGDVKTFAMSGGTTGDTLTGYAVISGGVTPTLLYYELFATPQTLVTVGNAVILVPQFTFVSET